MTKQTVKRQNIKTWDDIMKKPFKVLLTEGLVKKLGLPLYLDEKGLWWLEVNKEKKKK